MQRPPHAGATTTPCGVAVRQAAPPAPVPRREVHVHDQGYVVADLVPVVVPADLDVRSAPRPGLGQEDVVEVEGDGGYLSIQMTSPVLSM